jgi:hypothetical protein
MHEHLPIQASRITIIDGVRKVCSYLIDVYYDRDQDGNRIIHEIKENGQELTSFDRMTIEGIVNTR